MPLNLRQEVVNLLKDPSPETYRPDNFLDLSRFEQNLLVNTFREELRRARRRGVPLGLQARVSGRIPERDAYIERRLKQIDKETKRAYLLTFGGITGSFAAAVFIAFLFFF